MNYADMTEQEFEEASNTYAIEEAYAEYIMANAAGERVIGNGDMLIRAMEDGYLWESFKDHMIGERA